MIKLIANKIILFLMINLIFILCSFNILKAWHKTDIPENIKANEIKINFEFVLIFSTLIFFIPLVISNIAVNILSIVSGVFIKLNMMFDSVVNITIVPNITNKVLALFIIEFFSMLVNFLFEVLKFISILLSFL